MNERPRVTVAVVQRETFRYTTASIESLYATAGIPFDLVYVDGGSPPAARAQIDAAAARFGFRVLRRAFFLTPNEARNIALAAIDTEFVAFVDNDLIFGEAWLERLLTCAGETGAGVAGPLICVDLPLWTKIHVAGGGAHVEETPAGRFFRDAYRYPHFPLASTESRLVREPLEMLELHVLLVRRSLFGRIGPWDENLRSNYEHADFCMLARAAGETLMFEPASRVNQLLPAPFPFDRQSVPFFLERWSTANNRATIDHFRTKWKLAAGDPALAATFNWCEDRRLILFPYLHLKLFRHAWRRLKRTLLQEPLRR